jgi:DNA (cytosine-5)-methyltransferase 1
MIGIDLFSGAGGMSLGAVQAGVEVAVAVETDPHAAHTYSTNHPKTSMLNADIRTISPKKLKHLLWNDANLIVFGGPPCQGFSYSNQRTRCLDNTENWLFLEFVRIVRLIRPAWVVFENVRGFVNTAEGVFVENVASQLEKIGYTLSHELLNAMDFGVPQNRVRFFLVGSRDGVKFKMPHPTLKKSFTVHDAISDLPKLENGASISVLPYNTAARSAYARDMRRQNKTSPNHLVTRNADSILKRYKHIPQGGNWMNIPARLMKNYTDRTRCHTGIYHRLRFDAPSVVIGNYRKNMLIHPEQDRGLSVREAARIQSFPDWFEFKGSIGYQQQQVANAVPPRLAQAVFSAILIQDGQCPDLT